eukprot:COSAG01_NODE_1502_length_10101_cov_6.907119_2_plen_31_part_00
MVMVIVMVMVGGSLRVAVIHRREERCHAQQ